MNRPMFEPGEDEPSSPQLPPSEHTIGQADYSDLMWRQLRDLEAATKSAHESQERLAISIDRLEAKAENRAQNLERSALEIQISLSDVKAEIRSMKSSVDSTKSKVEDLVNWKNRILGGVIVLGLLIAAVWALATKVGDYITFKPPSSSSAVVK